MERIAGTPGTIHDPEGRWRCYRRITLKPVPRRNRKYFSSLQNFTFPNDLPEIIKVDLVISREGEVRICKIDAHNPNGMGYTALAREMHNAKHPSSKPGFGILEAIKNRIDPGERYIIVLPQKGTFYVPENKFIVEDSKRWE